MNYLAHLHIAEHSDSNLLGNLLGDFVKGNPAEQFEPEIVQGIRLHRWVDAYTDSHNIMKQAKDYFTESTRRFSPIALDMFWDHCLAKHWTQFHSSSLMDFIDNAERLVRSDHNNSLPERYLSVTEKMWQGRWLESYRELDNIQFALQRMSLRSERMKPLANCFTCMDDSYLQLESLFFELYPDVLEKAKRVRL